MHAVHASVGRVQPWKVMRRALEDSPLRCFERTTPHPHPRHAVPVRQQIGFDLFECPLPRGTAPSHLQRWVLGCGTERPHTAADSGTVTTCPAGPRCDSPLETGRFGSALRSAPGRTRPTGAPSSSRAPAWETRLGQGRSAGRRGTPGRRAAR